MEIIKYDDLQEQAMQLRNLEIANLPPQFRQQAERTITVAQNIRTLSSRINKKVNAFIPDGPTNVLGFYDTNQGEIYENINLISGNTASIEALNTLTHEKIHHDSGIFSLSTPEQIDHLATELNIPDLPSLDLVEGFTEAINKQKHHSTIGAYPREVQAAEQLQQLAQEHLQISLFDLFLQGRRESIEEHLHTLAQIIQVKQTLHQHNFN